MRISLILALTLCASSLAHAAPDSLEELVARDIQGLVDDTVNEGEQTAYVVYEREQPLVECKLSNSRQQPGYKWAFCRVAFRVRYESAQEMRTCHLLYTFHPNDLRRSLRIGDEDTEMDCVEYLGESIE